MNPVQLSLHRSRFPQWRPLSAGWLAGSVYADGRWLTVDEVGAILASVDSAAAMQRCLAGWNGAFALVWQANGHTFLATDVARTVPLFWNVGAEVIQVTDQLMPGAGTPSRWWGQQWLVQTEFTPGHETLLQGWRQLQAGELLAIHPDGLCYLHTWFSHQRPAPFPEDEQTLTHQFLAVIDRITDRLIAWAQGRTIVVPLSGGYDSRILLAALQQRGYPHLKAFTYGQPDSWEVQLAQSVAHTLGIDWQFIHYTAELLQSFGDKNWCEFAEYAANACAIPQEQDYFALSVLRERGWLEADSVLCPGFCGDFHAGSYSMDGYFRWSWRKEKALQDFLYHRFSRYPSAEVRALWQPFLPKGKIANPNQAASLLEDWATREYVTKFIVNGVRAYEWFDCAWYLPLWDAEFVAFWQRVPQPLRHNMYLYRKVLEDHYFIPSSIFHATDREKVKQAPWWYDYVSIPLKEGLKQYRPVRPYHNINGLHALTPIIQQALAWETPQPEKSVNEMLGHWMMRRYSG